MKSKIRLENNLSIYIFFLNLSNYKLIYYEKSILFLFFSCLVFNFAQAQDELYVNLWYGQIKNEDVARHLELEEKF